MITWYDVAADELGARDLYDALVLRAEVFVVEQDCVYADPDGADLRPGVRRQRARVGRVVVAPAARGGLGRSLMEQALAVCEEHHPGRAVELGGQAHLVDFYASLGFVPVGEVYDEDGIPHQWMRREPA